jgi:hypothetical protein
MVADDCGRAKSRNIFKVNEIVRANPPRKITSPLMGDIAFMSSVSQLYWGLVDRGTPLWPSISDLLGPWRLVVRITAPALFFSGLARMFRNKIRAASYLLAGTRWGRMLHTVH